MNELLASIRNPWVVALMSAVFALGGVSGTAVSDGVSIAEFAEHKTASTATHEKTDSRLAILEQQRAADIVKAKNDDERNVAILLALQDLKTELRELNKRIKP